jgi:hypothetical protein
MSMNHRANQRLVDQMSPGVEMHGALAPWKMSIQGFPTVTRFFVNRVAYVRCRTDRHPLRAYFFLQRRKFHSALG